MGTQPPSQEGGGAPIFGPCLLWPNGWMDQDGTWHGGTEVGLGPVHIVLDGDTDPLPKKGGRAPRPIFGPSLLWPNGWMHQDASWYGVGLCPGDFVLDGDPAPRNFRPMFIIVIVISLEHCTGVRRYWFVQFQVQVLVFCAFKF